MHLHAPETSEDMLVQIVIFQEQHKNEFMLMLVTVSIINIVPIGVGVFHSLVSWQFTLVDRAWIAQGLQSPGLCCWLSYWPAVEQILSFLVPHLPRLKNDNDDTGLTCKVSG